MIVEVTKWADIPPPIDAEFDAWLVEADRRLFLSYGWTGSTSVYPSPEQVEQAAIEAGNARGRGEPVPEWARHLLEADTVRLLKLAHLRFAVACPRCGCAVDTIGIIPGKPATASYDCLSCGTIYAEPPPVVFIDAGTAADPLALLR